MVFASVVLLGGWPFCYELGIVRGNPCVQAVAVSLLNAGVLWALLVSPLWWHRDSSQSLGFGDPRRLFAADRRLLALVFGVFTTLVVVGVVYWRLTARFFRLPKAALLWPESPGGQVAAVVFCSVAAAVFAMWFVRYDNFLPALRAAFVATLPIVILAAVIAYLHRGLAAFTAIQWQRIPLDVLAYTFWGGLQQMLFVGYFGTRVRKGFAPARSRLGRLAIALLSASFFALIHLPSYRLVFVTLVLGTIFAWLAMEDRYRNLAAFALVHGFLGAAVAKLFTTEAAGALRIGFRVGPWNAGADRVVTGVALVCVAMYVGAAVLVVRRRVD